ncbi:MAG: hypothetical protein J0L92_26175 [Deltaproteobacteria bacterium]|nr:hypothetical protein [Deltaproteobacteria bacterium]
MRALRFTAAVLALVALPACSLLGLDKFQQQRCTRDDQCSSLEAISPTGDACRTWQCNNPTDGDGICEARTRDDDGDNAPPMMCAGAAAADCDDMDPARSPMVLEACNMVDDDCDGVVDPSFAAMSSTNAMLGASAGRVTFSRGYTGGEVSVVRVPPRGTADPLQLGMIQPGSTSALVITPAMTDDSESGAGAHATLGDDGTLVVYDPVAAAEDCGGDATRPIQARWLRSNGTVAATSCLDQTRLAAATLTPEPEGDVLLVWVDDAGTRECGSAPDAPVRARVLRTIGGATPRVDSGPVVELGSTTDALGPSVTFVEGQGWVIAHVGSAGQIVVNRLAVTAAIADYDQDAVAMISSIATTSAAEVTVSVGDAGSVAVAYTTGGCAATNAVEVRTAEISGSSVTFGAAIAVTEEANRNRRAPVATYHPVRDEWVVFYREVDDEQALRLTATGTAVGAPVALGIGTVAGRPYVEAISPSGGTPSWGFVAVTTGGEVRSGTLACVSPT